MKILCHDSFGNPQANQQVNRVGKYLYKNIDGALEYKISPNIFNMWFTLLYEVPNMGPKYKRVDDDLHEMVINIGITTYQNKIRVNVIEETPNERTIGHDVYKPEEMINLAEASDKIFDRVVQRVSRAYKDYDFVF